MYERSRVYEQRRVDQSACAEWVQPSSRFDEKKTNQAKSLSLSKEGSFESTSTIISPSGENRDVSTFGARIVHDTDDLLARKIRAEYEKQSSVVFSLGERERERYFQVLVVVETSWLDEVLSSKREEGLDVEK